MKVSNTLGYLIAVPVGAVSTAVGAVTLGGIGATAGALLGFGYGLAELGGLTEGSKKMGVLSRLISPVTSAITFTAIGTVAGVAFGFVGGVALAGVAYNVVAEDKSEVTEDLQNNLKSFVKGLRKASKIFGSEEAEPHNGGCRTYNSSRPSSPSPSSSLSGDYLNSNSNNNDGDKRKPNSKKQTGRESATLS